MFRELQHPANKFIGTVTGASDTTLTLNVTGSLAVGDTVTGAVSGATGRVIYRGAAGMVAFTRETGEFQSGEGLTVSGTPVATVTGLGGFEDRPDFDVDMLDLAMQLIFTPLIHKLIERKRRAE